MPRMALAGVALFAFVNTSVIMKDVTTDEKTNEAQEIDPIITGQTVNDDYIDEWELQREKYLECGKCAIIPQPYPGE